MDKRIIFQKDDGGVGVIIPTLNSGLTINQIAAKDVGAGVPYKIVDATLIPNDRTFREAWEVDFSSPDGHGVGYEAWFAQQGVS
jgi:hypothetical protein